MTNQSLTQELEELAQRHGLTTDQLSDVLSQHTASTASTNASVFASPSKHFSLSEIFYYIGGAIVVLGVVVMVMGSWGVLSPLSRILITLGLAMAAYVAGVILSLDEKFDGLSRAFHLVAALLTPVGLLVAFTNAGVDTSFQGVEVVVSLMLVAVYGSSYYLFKKNLFLTFFIIYSTWLFFALTDSLTGGSNSVYSNIYLYKILVNGLAYMLLGYKFSQSKRFEGLSGWLYGFGSFGFLAAALSLSGLGYEHNLFWELVFPVLALGVVLLSVVVKNRAFLVWGSFFIMVYILKITTVYFSEGLGWPFALILAGLALMGVGYYSVYLNKKYIAQG